MGGCTMVALDNSEGYVVKRELHFSDKTALILFSLGTLVGWFVWGQIKPSHWGYTAHFVAALTFGLGPLMLWFGAILPLYAWYKYYRVERDFNVLEAAAVVLGGLGFAAGTLYLYNVGFDVLKQHPTLAVLYGIVCVLGLAMAVYEVIYRRRLRVINGKFPAVKQG